MYGITYSLRDGCTYLQQIPFFAHRLRSASGLEFFRHCLENLFFRLRIRCRRQGKRCMVNIETILAEKNLTVIDLYKRLRAPNSP